MYDHMNNSVYYFLYVCLPCQAGMEYTHTLSLTASIALSTHTS